jgi:hypothetical protein
MGLAHACHSPSPFAYAGQTSSAQLPRSPMCLLLINHSPIRFFGLFHCSIVYVESFARVKSLSLSGHIMYYVADKFVVQWEGLCALYPRAIYAGVLC